MAVQTLRENSPLKTLIAEYNQAVTLLNEIQTNYDALLAKLDADLGVTDTDYASTLATTESAADTLLKVW